MTIVCFGDSNTYGWDPETQTRLPPDRRWPGVLRAELGPGHEVIEEGLNGRTTASDDPYSEYRSGRDFLLPCLWSHAPVDLVAIMLGTNDLKVTFALSATDISRGAELLVDLARRSLAGPDDGPPGVLLIAPPPLGPASAISPTSGLAGGVDRSRELAPLYRRVAADAGVDFLDAAEFIAVSELDGVHLDAAAQRGLGLAVARHIRAPGHGSSTVD